MTTVDVGPGDQRDVLGGGSRPWWGPLPAPHSLHCVQGPQARLRGLEAWGRAGTPEPGRTTIPGHHLQPARAGRVEVAGRPMGSAASDYHERNRPPRDAPRKGVHELAILSPDGEWGDAPRRGFSQRLPPRFCPTEGDPVECRCCSRFVTQETPRNSSPESVSPEQEDPPFAPFDIDPDRREARTDGRARSSGGRTASTRGTRIQPTRHRGEGVAAQGRSPIHGEPREAVSRPAAAIPWRDV